MTSGAEIIGSSLYIRKLCTIFFYEISGVFFALGMCMALLPEWNMRNQGIVIGIIGIVVLLMLIPLLKGLHD